MLTAMPAAKGLFQKAVALSGSAIEARDQEYARKVGEYILKEAGLKPTEIDKLQEMPWKDYLELANRAAAKYAQDNKVTDYFKRGFGPVADGIDIPKGQFYSDPNGLSADVPMIISTTFHEWGAARNNPQLENITREKAIENLKTQMRFSGGLGDKAEAIYDAYAKAFPDAKPVEIMTLVTSNRKSAIATADAKSKQPAPVYLAWFGWEPPMFSGRMRAFHCLDICFWFANTDLMVTHTGGGKRPRELSDKMSGALLNFMRTGNPNGAGLPEWPRYTTENGETMILNDQPVVKNDPDRTARQLLN
jgi:para-nitrobenzyl esterase